MLPVVQLGKASPERVRDSQEKACATLSVQ